MAPVNLQGVSLTSTSPSAVGAEPLPRRYSSMYEEETYDQDGGTPTEAPRPAGAVMAPDDARHARLQQIMQKAMAGQLPRGRQLKTWENQALKPRHMQILFMSAAGYKNQEIAEVVDMDPARVSVILRHPDAQSVLSHMVSIAAESMLDIKARIQAHAGEMLDNILEVTRTTANEKLKSDNSFKMLAMAGYGEVERRQVEHKLEIPSEQASAMMDALREGEEIASIDYSSYLLEHGEEQEPREEATQPSVRIA